MWWELGKIYFWIGNSIVIVTGIVLITKNMSAIDNKVEGVPCFVPAAKEKVDNIETSMPFSSFKKDK